MAMALGFTAIPAEAAPPPKADYVALGDSFTAGTGAGAAERPEGVDCWQSQRGYVDAVGKTGRVNLVANAACHGAVLFDDNPFHDEALYTPTVFEQLQGLIKDGLLTEETELVSITAGANDLGFAYVLGQCAVSTEACNQALTSVTTESALGNLTADLVATYVAIQQAAPNATIVVLGYPLLFDPTSQFAPIPVANQFAINGATLALNELIANAVTLAKVNAIYVDVTARFAGHAVNSADPWLVLDFSQPLPDYNFHPNRAGHTLGYAAALKAAVNLPQLARQ